MMWVGMSGQFEGRDGFSDREALLLEERFFPPRLSAFVGLGFFSSSTLKVDCNGTFRAQCMRIFGTQVQIN